MRPPESGGIQASLEAIYKAQRTIRDVSSKIERSPAAAQAIQKAIGEARSHRADDERALRLGCLVRRLQNIPAPKAIDLLVDLLGDDVDDVRAAAGIVLEDIGRDRSNDLRTGIGRALTSLPPDHHALRELPFVVLNVSEGDARAALVPFLKLRDAEAVASAIEALVENADPDAIGELNALKEDKREVEIGDDSTDETVQVTIGELARDAVDALDEIRKAIAQPDR